MQEQREFEVIIIGGSYAGLSAAMSLGRSLRKVLIIDSGLPCNRQTPHSHNFITQDGERPADITRKAREQVLAYDTVRWLDDLAVGGEKTGSGFTISTRANGTFSARKLVFATGIKDMMPEIKGFAACWGISVVHCPYCHGYEFRRRKTGIMANGEKGWHLASLVNNLTDNVTVLTSGISSFDAEQTAKLDKHHIGIIETEITEIEHKDGIIEQVVFRDGSKAAFDVLYAAIPFIQHCDIPVALGCELTDQGYIKVDHFHKASVEGIFACGDNVAMMRSVANAVYSGNLTGALINKELTEEQF